MLGIPDRSLGCLFDLDGVLTQTAAVHAVGEAGADVVVRDQAKMLDER